MGFATGRVKSTMALRKDFHIMISNRRPGSVRASIWRPLRQPLFRALWVASLTSNIGTWMHESAAGWLMTSLTSSPVLIALMQTATTLPIFFLALPAGALADGVDRRWMLILTQASMFIAAATLGVLTLADAMTPWLLLILTFALGAGAAMNAPAWQATAPELVPRADLPSAVALTGMGLNLARAVGPALGGIVVALAGAWAVFFVNAVSFLSIIVVLYGWRQAKPNNRIPSERVLSSIRAGIRYARHAPALKTVLLRTGLFVPFASALWALLPVLARHEMGLDSIRYGILFGSLGVGAVAGAIGLRKTQHRFSKDSLATVATILFAAATAALAEIRNFSSLCVVMVAGGAAWITLMASLNIATQTAVPSWVRARALALYLLMFQGSMAVGSAVWGAVSERAGISVALWCAAGGLVFSLAAIRRYPLAGVEELDLNPSAHWPEPTVVVKPQAEDGPVLVTVEYRIDPQQSRDFTVAMQPVRQQRLRDGALRSSLYSDPADPSRYVETFVVESWAEHLRQHERVTVNDRVAEDRARAFHIGDAPPATSHFISAHGSEKSSDTIAAKP
jgi:MFS family permease